MAFDRRKAVEAALAAVDAGSAELLKRFRASGRALEAWHKAPGAPVTEADIASDQAIAAALSKAGLPGRIVSEESPQGAAPGREAGAAPGMTALAWLVDPLCGTLPYRDGLAHWGINIALRDGGDLELGVLSVPLAREVFLAVRGNGVARNGVRYTATPPRARLSEAVVSVEIDYGAEWPVYAPQVARWAPAVGAVNMYSSIAYPGAQLLQGRLAAMVVFKVAPVHAAACAAIALELGLKVTDAGGEPIDWSRDEELSSLVVGWPGHHGALIEAIAGS